jgi:hypothetical protein
MMCDILLVCIIRCDVVGFGAAEIQSGSGSNVQFLGDAKMQACHCEMVVVAAMGS